MKSELAEIADFLRASAPDQYRTGQQHRNEGGGNAPGPTYWAVDQLYRDLSSAEDACRDFLRREGEVQHPQADQAPVPPRLQSFATALGITSLTVDLQKVIGSGAPKGLEWRFVTFNLRRDGRWNAPVPGLLDFATLDDAVAATRTFWSDSKEQQETP